MGNISKCVHPAKGTDSKNTEKTLSLKLRLILGTETVDNNQHNKNNNKNSKPWGKERIWFPKLPHFQIQMSNFQQQITRHTKNKQTNNKTQKAYSKEKYKSTETLPEKDLMAELLEKDFKTIDTKILKQLKGDMEKDKKMMKKMEMATKRKPKKKWKKKSGAGR